MKTVFTTCIIAFFTTMAFSQKLTQTVRGNVVDNDSKLPLVGALVKVRVGDSLLVMTTNTNGEFKFEKVPVGRIAMVLSYLGYENKAVPDIEVNSGKEKILNLTMQEAVIKMNEVVITANKTDKGAPVNEMSLISTRSVSLEESKRYAGSFNDPSRVLTNFAGVTSSQNGENDIIVRGNSPKYIQWRLEGVEITNPTHFADQNAVKGGISAMNNSLLSKSDFSTGAFAPEYGDALSGVYDVKLRAGNNEKFESAIGFGLLGTDVTLEGPFKKGYGGSYLVNYRFSTISMISKLGLVHIDGNLNFQDAAFKVVLPTVRAGVFSFFGLGGLSNFSLEKVTPDKIATPGSAMNATDISEDYDKGTYLSNYGMNHTFNISNTSFIKSTLSYANSGISDDVFKTKKIKIYDKQNNFLQDSVGNKLLDYRNRLVKSTYRGAITYNNKLNAKNTIQIGTKYALFGYEFNLSWLNNSTRITAVEMNENISTIRNFVSWKCRLNEAFTIVAGFHNMNVMLNHKSTFEPRLAVNWAISSTSAINAGFGKHSTMESVHNYFAKVMQKDGTVAEPNKDLGLLKAYHYVLGYEKRFTENVRSKIEAYYQDLYDLPVENSTTSYYSTINEGTDFKYVNLINKGTGKNYGLELTIERFFDKGYYYLINSSLYNSKYKAFDGIERNTQYNGNYLVNILCGKEYINLGRKKNQSLNLNAKVFFGGGQKYIPLLRDERGNLAVDPATNKFWDYNKAYKDKIDNLYQVTISASYKWNKPKATHEVFINLDNLTNTKGRLTEYYDQSKPGAVGYVTQFGFFPNLMYRAYF